MSLIAFFSLRYDEVIWIENLWPDFRVKCKLIVICVLSNFDENNTVLFGICNATFQELRVNHVGSKPKYIVRCFILDSFWPTPKKSTLNMIDLNDENRMAVRNQHDARNDEIETRFLAVGVTSGKHKQGYYWNEPVPLVMRCASSWVSSSFQIFGRVSTFWKKITNELICSTSYHRPLYISICGQCMETISRRVQLIFTLSRDGLNDDETRLSNYRLPIFGKVFECRVSWPHPLMCQRNQGRSAFWVS